MLCLSASCHRSKGKNMTTETETPTDDEHANPEPITVGGAFMEYFTESDEVKDEDKPKAFPEVQRFVRWIGEEQRVDQVIASEVARFSETYRSNASEEKKAQAMHIKGFLNFLKKRQYTSDSLASHIRVRPRSTNGQRATVAWRNKTDFQEITQQGYDEMQEKLAAYKVESTGLVDQIQKARATGDVRENSPLDALRDRQGIVEAEIRRLDDILKSAKTIDETQRRASEEVQIGSWVTIRKTDDQKSTDYQIVSSNEADPLQSKISDISNVGSALMGKKAGDKVEVQTNRKDGNKFISVHYEVVSIF